MIVEPRRSLGSQRLLLGRLVRSARVWFLAGRWRFGFTRSLLALSTQLLCLLRLAVELFTVLLEVVVRLSGQESSGAGARRMVCEMEVAAFATSLWC